MRGRRPIKGCVCRLPAANESRDQGIEIWLFFLIPVLVNILNVRRYGEIEFWLTAVKIQAILVIIIVGFVIAAGGRPQLLGTDLTQYNVVPCSPNVTCVPPPGFPRILLPAMCI